MYQLLQTKHNIKLHKAIRKDPKEGYEEGEGPRWEAKCRVAGVTWLVHPEEKETEGRSLHWLEFLQERQWRGRY